MKTLLVILTLTLLAMTAKAVTSTKSSSAPLTETQIKDEALAKELENEVVAATPVKKVTSASTARVPLAPASIETGSDELSLDANNDEAVAQEMAAIEAQQSMTQVKLKKKTENNMYISGNVGMIAYPGISNITGKYSGSFALGYVLDKTFMFEAGIGLAQYELEDLNPIILNRKDNYEINQYAAHIAAKYRMAFGKFVPNAGALLAITQRQKTLRDPNNSGNTSLTVDKGTSQATDAGLIGGIDFEMSKDFAIGLDFKYMMNLSNSSEAVSNVNANSQNGTNLKPIETLESYTAGLSARMNF